MVRRSLYILALAIVGVGAFLGYKIYQSPLRTLPKALQEEETFYKVALMDLQDEKPVSVTVDSQHRTFARSRISGTIINVKVIEGDVVKQGEVLANIVDMKIVPQIEAIDAKIKAEEDKLKLAKITYDRAVILKNSKVMTQANYDEIQTNLRVAENNLKNLQAQKITLLEQQKEGDVLAPLAGKVLKIPLTLGSVIMPGENVVELAGGDFILKMTLPESHAAYIRLNDPIYIEDTTKKKRKGVIAKIYPKLEEGQIIADIKLDDIDGLYVGQVMTAYVGTNKRKGICIPHKYLYERQGLFFVKLKGIGEIPVEIGKRDEKIVEIISGLKEGDKLV